MFVFNFFNFYTQCFCLLIQRKTEDIFNFCSWIKCSYKKPMATLSNFVKHQNFDSCVLFCLLHSLTSIRLSLDPNCVLLTSPQIHVLFSICFWITSIKLRQLNLTKIGQQSKQSISINWYCVPNISKLIQCWDKQKLNQTNVNNAIKLKQHIPIVGNM